MQDISVKSGSYAECNVDFKEKDPKFKTGDHVIISKDMNFFAKECTPNCSVEFLKFARKAFIKNHFYIIIPLSCVQFLQICDKSNRIL